MWSLEFKYVFVSLGRTKNFNFHMWQLKFDNMKGKYEKVLMWNCQDGNHSIDYTKTMP
jgi:hypothetical protein